MNKTVAQLTSGVIVAVLGAGLGVLTERYRTGEETKTRYLHYRIDQQPIYLPDLPGKKLAITLDGERVDNLSWVAIDAFNLSDRDFEDVLVQVDLVPRTGSTLSIISSLVQGPGDRPASFQETQEMLPSPSGTIRLGYRVPVMNRVPPLVFRATFFLQGEAQNVIFSAEKKGVGVQHMDAWREYEGPAAGAGIFFMALLVSVVLGGVGVVVTRLERRKALKLDQELKGHLTRALADDETRKGLNLGAEADTSRLAAYCVGTLQRFRWERVPRMLRAFSSYPPPPSQETNDQRSTSSAHSNAPR